MNSKHAKTLAAIFEIPLRADVAWRDVESLFRACGAEVIEGRGSRVTVVLNDTIGKFHRPHPERITDKGALRSAREFLLIAGVEP